MPLLGLLTDNANRAGSTGDPGGIPKGDKMGLDAKGTTQPSANAQLASGTSGEKLNDAALQYQEALSIYRDRMHPTFREQATNNVNSLKGKVAHQEAQVAAEHDGGSPSSLEELSKRYYKLSTGQNILGDRSAAKVSSAKGNIASLEATQKEEPGNNQVNRSLSLNYNYLGESLEAQGDKPAARVAYANRNIAQLEALVDDHPDNSRLQEAIPNSYFGLGMSLEAQGDKEGADKAFAEAKSIKDEIVPLNAEKKAFLETTLP